MSLIIPNIGNAVLLDPTSGAIKAHFTKLDSIKLDVDGKLTPVYGGPGMYSIVNISADRAPKVSLSGPEISLSAAAPLLGADITAAASGSPVQEPMIDVATISAAGTVILQAPISATVTAVSVMSLQDGKPFTGAASAPTAGQFQNPAASAASITFNTGDAGKTVIISYTTDNTTGGKIDILTTSIPGVYKFVAQGKVVNTEDPNRALVPITFAANTCQMIGTWSASMERQKASSNATELSILDPGGTTPAIQIITAAKFAG